MNWFKSFFKTNKPSPLPEAIKERVRVELLAPIEGEEYPEQCQCGARSFHLITEGQQQLQRCAVCRTRYRSTLAAAVLNEKCPDCGGELYEGPMGGAAMNIHCATGHRFWCGAPFGHFIVKRLT